MTNRSTNLARPPHDHTHRGESEQDRVRWARSAGFLFLFVMAASIVAEVGTAQIRGAGDFTDVADAVGSSSALYRLALLSMALCGLGGVVLAHALYVVLEGVNRRVAQLALWARLAEATIIGAMVAIRFGVMHLYAAEGAGPFSASQLEMLVAVVGATYGSGVHVWLLYWALGSALFFWLFYRSGYIPRLLAGFGVFASIVGLAVSAGSLVFPAQAATLQYAWVTSFIAEVGTGLWLLVRAVPPHPPIDQLQGVA